MPVTGEYGWTAFGAAPVPTELELAVPKTLIYLGIRLVRCSFLAFPAAQRRHRGAQLVLLASSAQLLLVSCVSRWV